MRSTTLVLLCLAAPAVAEDAAAKKALDDLQGKWEVVELSERGRKIDPAKVKNFAITFAGNTAEMPFDSKGKVKHTVTVRPAASPREIDLQLPSEIDGGQTIPGIYKLEDGVLTIALGFGKDAKNPGTRPTTFESTGAPNPSVVLVLKKAK
jgi:uncharacterized protein (TIGR03067 family)